ncbi:hypothetical protein [Siphonobacter curvatus]|uniref:DUF2306 domain-containing protein n=1 Tax=Siphonobacter curvatus TaxID=2094562 RepID=A0A2S7IKM3_9BACT|nr:hypothetical protein [Siphonobacter curvatus]PQA58272.1 hypothetical protein C5O19_00915 [Siphonobacter curvatus]
MKTLQASILVIHVICGFTALLSGLVPMIARKGGRLHNFWGLIYYWAMFGVFITTVGLFVLDPLSLKMQFFLPVAVGSFYQTFTGKRILLRKKSDTPPAQLDWAAMYGVSFFGLVTLAWSIQRFTVQQPYQGILFLFLTALCLANGGNDYKVFSGRVQPQRMHWFFTHLGRMLASYAATLTAFLVNVGPRFLPADMPSFVNLLLWIGPGVAVGFVISRLTKQYRKKMGLTAPTASATPA